MHIWDYSLHTDVKSWKCVLTVSQFEERDDKGHILRGKATLSHSEFWLSQQLHGWNVSL